jgi:dsDNA-specific endonuclease/ATPase MutS2
VDRSFWLRRELRCETGSEPLVLSKLFMDEKKRSTKQHEDATDIDPYNPFPDPVEIEITDVIDLHTIPPRDVKAVVEEYLFQSHQRGFRIVRIIHGKGIGVQKKMVYSILERTSFVQDWTDAPPEAGGFGATVVRMM